MKRKFYAKQTKFMMEVWASFCCVDLKVEVGYEIQLQDYAYDV